jgi:serine/threonine protein kinase
MGLVYEAVQGSLGRRVALKVLPADRGRGPFLERFWREARLAARLHHTNIVPVFGVGRAGDTHFYLMQYIDGRGLDCFLEDVRRRPPGTQLPRPESATLRASVGSTEATSNNRLRCRRTDAREFLGDRTLDDVGSVTGPAPVSRARSATQEAG